MSVTISDIARHVGASKMTVSLALRGTGRVGASTRQRIIAAANDLGYRPNAAAQAVSTGRFGCVALLLSTRGYGRSTLPENLLGGIEGALADNDLHLTVARLPDEKLTSEGVVPKILRQWSADGLLINYTDLIPQQMIELIRGYNVPAIWINTRQSWDCVHPDDFGAGRAVTEELIRLGHRRIAYVDYSHPTELLQEAHYSAHDRQAGYRAAMESAGLSPQVFQTAQPKDRAERHSAAYQWLQGPDRPTALIAYGEGDIVSAAIAATALGIAVPRDLRFATFANGPFSVGGQTVLTAEVPQTDLGRAAVKMLLEKITDPTTRLPCRAVPFVMHRFSEGN